MRLSRFGVEPYRPGPTTDPPIDPEDWLASFDGQGTWVEPVVVDDEPTWPVAGANAETPGDAVVLDIEAEWIVPAIGFHDGDQFIVRDETFEGDQQPPAIYLV